MKKKKMPIPILVWFLVIALAPPVIDSTTPNLPIVSNIAASERAVIPFLPAPPQAQNGLATAQQSPVARATPRAFTADDVWSFGTNEELSRRCRALAYGQCDCTVANPNVNTKSISCTAWFGLASGNAVCTRDNLTCQGSTSETGAAKLTCTAQGDCTLTTEKRGTWVGNWNTFLNT